MNLLLNPSSNNATQLKLTRSTSVTSSSASSSKNPINNKNKLMRRLSITYQKISHLSSSITDSIHNHYSQSNQNQNQAQIKIQNHSISFDSYHQHQPLIDPTQSPSLSSHRRKILGAVSDQWMMYSNDPNDYLPTLTIGFGASSVVKMAHFKPHERKELCAIKIIDTDRLSSKQIDYLRKETLLMSLAKHPNVLRVRGEWTQGSSLCIAMRLMKAGSIADLIRYKFQDGLDQVVIATVLIQALAGLNYLHSNHWIHRDLKAANLLLDLDGTVLLADFGISIGGNLEENHHELQQTQSTAFNLEQPSDHQSLSTEDPQSKKRSSLVGTAPFMAPEVVTHQLYNDRTDIWSFGITALEMATGKAPRSANTPARVLMKTVEEPSPTLDRKRAGSPYEYSKNFKSFIDRCLSKDPTKRPTSKDLLFHEKFFRIARNKEFLVRTILVDLPPIELRQERRLAAHQAATTKPLTPLESNGVSLTTTPWDFSIVEDDSSLDQKLCDEDEDENENEH